MWYLEGDMGDSRQVWAWETVKTARELEKIEDWH